MTAKQEAQLQHRLKVALGSLGEFLDNIVILGDYTDASNDTATTGAYRGNPNAIQGMVQGFSIVANDDSPGEDDAWKTS